MLFITSVVSLQGFTPVTAQTNVLISDVQVPNEVAQASSGQVQATVENLHGFSMEGFARFTDDLSHIRSHSPTDPLIDLVNFTIGPYETKTVVVDYTVNATATLGVHIATFEINVGGFAFLLEQYPITVISIARIIDVVPGSVFSHNQPGLLLISIENRVDLTQSVRIEVFGSKFINVSEEVDLAPGTNTVAIPLMPNVSHVYDFGMFQVNVSMYYLDEIISSEVVTIPVDMSLLNKALAVILPVSIFLILVLFYTFRKRQRVRAAEASE